MEFRWPWSGRKLKVPEGVRFHMEISTPLTATDERIAQMLTEILQRMVDIKRAIDLKVRRDEVTELTGRLASLQGELDGKTEELQQVKDKLDEMFDSVKPAAPTLTISADPPTAAGDGTATVTLTVAAEGADTVAVDQGVGSLTSTGGTAQVTASSPGAVTYTATAVGLGGTTTATVEVTWS